MSYAINPSPLAGAAGSLADTATGRELDALMHAALFNTDEWVVMKRGLFYRPGAKGYTSRESEAGVYTEAEALQHVYPHDEPVTMHRKTVPSYSTDHNACAKVKDAMGKRLFWCQIISDHEPDADYNRYHRVTFRHWDTGAEGEYIWEDEPTAICRAALKALEAEQVNSEAVQPKERQ